MARAGTMLEKSIDSSYLHTKLSVKLYVPKDFDTMHETMLCFMQDGDDYFQMGRIATFSDRLHEEQELINTVFAGIHYRDRQDRLKKYHPDGEEYHAYQQFLIHEALPLAEDILPINPLGIVKGLMGDSLAGTFAITTALQYPDHFQNVIMQSPLVDKSVLDIIKKAAAKNIAIYHSIGLNERAVVTSLNKEMDFVQPNQEASKLLKEKFSNYTYTEIKEGNHTWKYWQKEIPEILPLMFG